MSSISDKNDIREARSMGNPTLQPIGCNPGKGCFVCQFPDCRYSGPCKTSETRIARLEKPNRKKATK